MLLLPGGGDELQGIKKGILELADAIMINKADGESASLARKTKLHYQSAMSLLAITTFGSLRYTPAPRLSMRALLIAGR